MRYKTLSIAGFDGSGGAGIQADLKTFSAFGCYGMTVLTALPVQNTQGVKSCYELPLSAIDEQLHAIFEDIKPNSIKIGMLFKKEIVELVAHFLSKHAQGIPLVLDPVTIAKSGDSLLEPAALNAMKTLLLPLTTIVTPNLPEAKSLLNSTSIVTMPEMAQQLLELGSEYVLLKGGHLEAEHSNDFLVGREGNSYWLESPRVISKNTHGTGCTLSAAITSCLAFGFNMLEACQTAKNYIFHAIDAAKNEDLGKGFGPLHHFYHLWPTVEKIKLA
nr:bifunctional hydroxymethylpyrimidine kinase/phosphomethylpyrimidine kinase [Legionella nautarum]